MKNKNIRLIVLGLLILIQLAVPLRIIFNQEAIASEGTLYKFRLRPRDPVNPFSGRYLRLNFTSPKLPSSNIPDSELRSGQEIFVKLKIDEEGFAYPSEPSLTEIDDTTDYIKVSINYAYKDHIFVDYPFDKYFMEEEKAILADVKMGEILRDTTLTVYAEVYAKDGSSALSAVKINDQRIEDFFEENYMTVSEESQ